jgi:hypothetical protein
VQHDRGGHAGRLHDLPELRRFEVWIERERKPTQLREGSQLCRHARSAGGQSDARQCRPMRQPIGVCQSLSNSSGVARLTSLQPVRIIATLSSSVSMSNISRTPDSPAAPNA